VAGKSVPPEMKNANIYDARECITMLQAWAIRGWPVDMMAVKHD
jgi:hypothetical protein